MAARWPQPVEWQLLAPVSSGCCLLHHNLRPGGGPPSGAVHPDVGMWAPVQPRDGLLPDHGTGRISISETLEDLIARSQ